jgi:hypothetical protein
MPNPDSHTKIIISLESSETSGETARYLPGSTISGKVAIKPQQDLVCKAILLQLKWFTQGRGEMDEEVVSERVFHQGTLTGGATLNERFAFILPSKPWSFSGHYINILWAIHVKIDLPLKTDMEAVQIFVMAPEAKPVQIVSG